MTSTVLPSWLHPINQPCSGQYTHTQNISANQHQPLSQTQGGVLLCSLHFVSSLSPSWSIVYFCLSSKMTEPQICSRSPRTSQRTEQQETKLWERIMPDVMLKRNAKLQNVILSVNNNYANLYWFLGHYGTGRKIWHTRCRSAIDERFCFVAAVFPLLRSSLQFNKTALSPKPHKSASNRQSSKSSLVAVYRERKIFHRMVPATLE